VRAQRVQRRSVGLSLERAADLPASKGMLGRGADPFSGEDHGDGSRSSAASEGRRSEAGSVQPTYAAHTRGAAEAGLGRRTAVGRRASQERQDDALVGRHSCAMELRRVRRACLIICRLRRKRRTATRRLHASGGRHVSDCLEILDGEAAAVGEQRTCIARHSGWHLTCSG
jgi:hypothetical protein